MKKLNRLFAQKFDWLLRQHALLIGDSRYWRAHIFRECLFSNALIGGRKYTNTGDSFAHKHNVQNVLTYIARKTASSMTKNIHFHSKRSTIGVLITRMLPHIPLSMALTRRTACTAV